MGKLLLFVLLFSVGPCRQAAHLIALPETLPKQADQNMYVDAHDQKSQIEAALPSYEQDDLARYERKEIATVEADLAMIDQGPTASSLDKSVQTLTNDWETLVALDGILQKEHLT